MADCRPLNWHSTCNGEAGNPQQVSMLHSDKPELKQTKQISQLAYPFKTLQSINPCIPLRTDVHPLAIVVFEHEENDKGFYSPLDGMLVHCRVIHSSKFAGTHSYIWVELGTVRVIIVCPKITTWCPRPGLQPRLLDPKTNALSLAIRPPHLPSNVDWCIETGF